jgi:RNA polymerase sigma-70 factor (ECF subfamily)
MTLLAEQFEVHRVHLRGIAYRMLGSMPEAEDAVQEAWLRLQRAGMDVKDLRAWLTTVVARVCFDELRARRSRPDKLRDQPPTWGQQPQIDPEQLGAFVE